MLTTTILAALAALPQALALALPDPSTSAHTHNEGIKWKGVIVPGEAPSTLFGTIEQIFDQIHAINPNYTAEADTLVSLPSEHGSALEAREVDLSPVLCRVMAAGRKDHLKHLAIRLINLGGWCESAVASCVRLECKRETGAYLCGESGQAAFQLCGDVGVRLWRIADSCCQNHAATGLIRGEGFSVWGGYGNCEEAPLWPNIIPYPTFGPMCSP